MKDTKLQIPELEDLRRCNPTLPLYSVHDPEFAPYGRILELGDTSQLHETLEKTPIPESGNRYTASREDLEAVDVMGTIQGVFGFMDIQAGCCNGRGDTLNALEYHKCSEALCFCSHCRRI